MKKVHEAALRDIGLSETPGAEHNERIVKMFADVGHPNIVDDETSWCAAFVGSKLKECGLPHLRKLTARSYLQWGEEVPLEKAKLGDIVVFWRGHKDSWQGHVGFFSGLEGQFIRVLGGNQSNKVSIARYPVSQLLGVRTVTIEDRQNESKGGIWARIMEKLFGRKWCR